VDVVSVATPNHWHAPATILACSAGKHVYVEKPGSHNPREGELMVAAARKNKRVVQMGNQRRSVPWMIELMDKLKSGEIGEVKFARSWYNNGRQSIGQGKIVHPPKELDYSLWQGPAPERPYKDNLVHYQWHWRWHWGGGELANNGVHSLDLMRWGLGVDYPKSVVCGGGKWVMPADDDQETPDTYIVTYDFGGKGGTWEGHSCHPRGFENSGFGVNFYGTKGHLVIAGDAYKFYDLNGKQLSEYNGKRSDVDHFRNFFECIRNDKKPNAEIEDGQRSTLLCHLGNIAWRTGQTVHFDPRTKKITDDKKAKALWSREYRRGWEPKV
jgi:predicted dehydrogenase